MRILVLCEGSDEESLINILLDSNKLEFTRDALIGRRVYPLRNLKNPTIISELQSYGDKVEVYRIGDTQNENLRIPNELKDIVSKDRIFKYCTKPELEILYIINENKISEFNKSNKKPSSFAKEKIKYNGRKYTKDTGFIKEYFKGNRVINLINSIKEYKRIKKGSHNKDEMFLADLLKKGL